MKTKRIALRVSLNSALFILTIYVVMQVFAYLRDNMIFGVSDLSGLPASIAAFIGGSVLPPLTVFAFLVYLAALPLQRVQRRLEAGEQLEEALVEATRRKMQRFSTLILAVNLAGFVLGFILQLAIEKRIHELFWPSRLMILSSNIAGAVVYALAQTSIDNLAFADLRERLGIREIGNRKRELRGTTRQVVLSAFLVLYVLTFVQFQTRDVIAFQSLERETLEAVRSGAIAPDEAAADFRDRFSKQASTFSVRPDFDAGTIPLPWERKDTTEDVQRNVFLLFLLFMFVIAACIQAVCSLEHREELDALAARIRDVVEGEGDLRRRLNLRRMDELGELSELVNRLLDRFRDVVSKIGVAAAKTRDGATAIDLVLQAAEGISDQTGNAVLTLTKELEAQSAESKVLGDALEALRAAAGGVAAAVETQRRFASETAAAMEEMTANIRSVEAMTSRSGSLSEVLSERGEAGSAAVSDTGKAIAEIQVTAAGVLDVLGTLSKISGDTNLLAMNAAIEAAHAGDRGAGFAVVADEVRNLASTAGKQTKAIKSLVGEMSDRVKRGVERSEVGGEVFGSIAEGIVQAAAISREIAEAMKEQAAGTRSVEASLSQVIAASDAIVARMDEQRKETERMSEYLASALKRLSDLAASSRSQAAAVDELRQSFAAVRYEADRNLASVDALNKALSGFKV